MGLHSNKASFGLEIFPVSKDIFFVSSVWFLTESTTLKLDLSALAWRKKKKKVGASVFVPGVAPSYTLSERLSAVFHHCSAAKHGVHQFIQHETLQNMRAKDRSLEWWLFGPLVPRGGKSERRMRYRERERERAEGGKGRTEMLWALMPGQCCMPRPPPLPWGAWMK